MLTLDQRSAGGSLELFNQEPETEQLRLSSRLISAHRQLNKIKLFSVGETIGLEKANTPIAGKKCCNYHKLQIGNVYTLCLARDLSKFKIHKSDHGKEEMIIFTFL